MFSYIQRTKFEFEHGDLGSRFEFEHGTKFGFEHGDLGSRFEFEHDDPGSSSSNRDIIPPLSVSFKKMRVYGDIGCGIHGPPQER
jgi:hypothetical protein